MDVRMVTPDVPTFTLRSTLGQNYTLMAWKLGILLAA